VASIVLAAEDVSPDELKARRERIEKMSEVERQSLKRKYEAFLALPEDRKDAFRQLHDALEDDATGQNLRNVLWNYDAWLRTLSPWERAQIQAETDPKARLELVRRIKSARDSGQVQPVAPERTAPRPPEGDSARRNRRSFWRLEEQDFRDVMRVVEKSLSLSTEARAELDALSPAHRDVRVLLGSIKQAHGDNLEAARHLWPDEPLMGSMIDAIKDERARKMFGNDDSIDDQRRHMKFLTLGTLRKEAEQELDRRVPNKDEVVKEFFRKLDQSERDRLMSRGFEGKDRGDFLAWRYLEKKQDPFARDLAELRRIWLPPRFDGRGDFRRQRRPNDGDDKHEGGRFRDGHRGPRDGRPDSPDTPPGQPAAPHRELDRQ
jgi:hypothetical protein